MSAINSMRFILLIGLFFFTISVLQASAKQEFVRVENGRFKVGTKDFFFVGSNFYRLGLSDRFSGQDYQELDSQGQVRYPLVDDVFEGYKKAGIKVVRLWAFSCEASQGGGVQIPLLTKAGLKQNPVQLNEEAFRKLDYVLASAGRHGVRLILPLVNFEPEYCGMEWWVNNTIGSTDKHLFYTDTKVWEKFSSYIRGILNRENIYTKTKYKDDPSIMAIELANEPHTKDYYECTRTGLSENACRERDMREFGVGDLVYEWLKKTSAYVRSIDSRHLIAHGEEGYLADDESLDPTCRDKHRWIHNGSKGTDYERNATIADIDFLTTHIYPDNWNIPISELDWVKRCVIDHRAAIAKQNGKPIILEETGFNENPEAYGQKEYKLDRPYFISKMFRMTTEAGFAGTMVWQAAPLLRTDRPAEDDDFTFPINTRKNGVIETSPEGHAVLLQVACMEKRALNKLSSSCEWICPKGTVVDDERWGVDEEGNACYLPDATQGKPSTPFPVCDNGSADASGWGWTKNEALCLAHSEAALQFPKAGGCSCRGA